MADLFSNVATTNAALIPGADAPVVRLNLDAAANAALKPFAGQGTVSLTVKQLLPGDLAVLALPNGQTITAQAPRTPLSLGSQLVVQLPSAGSSAAANAAATNNAVTLLARLATAVRQTAGAPTPAMSLPLPGGPLAGSSSNSTPLPLVNLQSILSQSPVLAAAEDILAAVANAATPTTGPTTPTVLPAGPVLLSPTVDQTVQNIVQNIATALPAGPAVLQVTALPTTPGGPQLATLFPIPAANTPTPAPQTVLINAGQTLPVGTEFTLAIPTPAATANSTIAAAPVVVQVASPMPLPPQPLVGAQVVSTADNTDPTRPTAPATVNPVAPVQATPATVAVNLNDTAAPPPAPQLARVLTPATPIANQPGQFTQQVLLANGSSATLTTPAPLPPGTSLLLQPNAAAPAQPSVTQIALPQTQPAPVAQALPSVPANIPVGQPLTAEVEASPTTDKTMQLTITGPAAQAGQTLTVSSPSPLPPGTVLGIRVNADAQVVVESLTPPAALAGQQTLAQFESQWPQLAKAAAQLNASNPALAAQLESRLPQAAALMPGLASYADALRQQTADKWLGNPVVSMLRSMGVDLTHDLSQLAIFRQPTPDGWQGMIFPYMENQQSQPRQGRFFWKNTQGEDERSSGNTRFLVEMNLSSMGEVQLDGLLTYPELWLKLRLHPPADTGFGPELQNIVQTMLQSFGLGGGISVESASVFPLEAARLLPKPATPTVAAEL